jgi:DNA-binding NtrC family response regulator
LFYRLNVISFEMPALRKRVEDIPLLVSHFLQKYCEKLGKPMKRMTPEVFGLFEAYPWPGNIRELENVIERIVAIEDRETITAGCLPQEILSPSKQDEPLFPIQPGFSLSTLIDDLTKKYISHALLVSGGNLRQAAPLLGLSYRTLRYLIEKYELRNVRREEKAEKGGSGKAQTL